MLAPSQLELPGFDHEDAPATPQRDGAETLENALAWLDEQGDKPVFLWLHFFDPHLPYEPPEDFAGLFAPPGTPELVDLENPFGRAVYSAEQIQAHIDRYDEEIAYTDHLVGRFLKALEAHLPSGESPLIAIAADHGEAMGELDARYRFAFDHGKFLYQSIVGVPLLFLWEGHIPAGVSIAGPAQLLDIAPTLADLIGDPGFENQGRSLAPYMHGQPQPEDWLAFIERRTLPLTKQLRFAARKQFAARDQRYKLILSTPLARTQLYDLKEDPGELHDLSGTLPEIEARLLAALEKWLATAAESGEWTTTVPDEKVEMLKALGYIDD
jgi:arylsulfatase A-like enzyme